MDKRILFPTDYSKNAWNAISYELQLYKNVHCEFYLLNAYQVSGYTLDSMMVSESGEPHYEKTKVLSEEAMDNLIGQIKFQPRIQNIGFTPFVPSTV